MRAAYTQFNIKALFTAIYMNGTKTVADHTLKILQNYRPVGPYLLKTVTLGDDTDTRSSKSKSGEYFTPERITVQQLH